MSCFSGVESVGVILEPMQEAQDDDDEEDRPRGVFARHSHIKNLVDHLICFEQPFIHLIHPLPVVESHHHCPPQGIWHFEHSNRTVHHILRAVPPVEGFSDDHLRYLPHEVRVVQLVKEFKKESELIDAYWIDRMMHSAVTDGQLPHDLILRLFPQDLNR